MRREEALIAIVLILVGGVGVVAQLLQGGVWGAQPTAAAVVLFLGVLALLGELVSFRRERTP